MTNGINNRLRRRKGFGLLPEAEHKALSSKGGKKGGLKGLAYIKKHDPERFYQIVSKGGKASQAKHTLPGDAGK